MSKHLLHILRITGFVFATLGATSVLVVAGLNEHAPKPSARQVR
ncbi:MAG: hypothetical protein ABI702_13235 [Burkholderiales bacterium]